jgi:hypothetical protein
VTSIPLSETDVSGVRWQLKFGGESGPDDNVRTDIEPGRVVFSNLKESENVLFLLFASSQFRSEVGVFLLESCRRVSLTAGLMTKTGVFSVTAIDRIARSVSETFFRLGFLLLLSDFSLLLDDVLRFFDFLDCSSASIISICSIMSITSSGVSRGSIDFFREFRFGFLVGTSSTSVSSIVIVSFGSSTLMTGLVGFAGFGSFGVFG